jgi:ribosomal protein L40E
MADQDDEKLTEDAKQILRKTKVPHKFCPYCGNRNEADAQNCAACGKDISWMRVPEPVPYSEPPKQRPRSLPEQQKIFTPKVILVIAIIVALLFAFVLVILLVTKGKSAELAPVSGLILAAGLCLPLPKAGFKVRRLDKLD